MLAFQHCYTLDKRGEAKMMHLMSSVTLQFVKSYLRSGASSTHRVQGKVRKTRDINVIECLFSHHFGFLM